MTELRKYILEQFKHDIRWRNYHANELWLEVSSEGDLEELVQLFLGHSLPPYREDKIVGGLMKMYIKKYGRIIRLKNKDIPKLGGRYGLYLDKGELTNPYNKDFDKVLQAKELPRPIVKLEKGSYDVLGGRSRLSLLYKHGYDAEVIAFDVRAIIKRTFPQIIERFLKNSSVDREFMPKRDKGIEYDKIAPYMRYKLFNKPVPKELQNFKMKWLADEYLKVFISKYKDYL